MHRVVDGSAITRQAASIGLIGRLETAAPALPMTHKRMTVDALPPIVAAQAKLRLR